MGTVRNWNRRLWSVSILTLACVEAQAYETVTHGVITKYSVEESVLNDPNAKVLVSLGLGDDVDDKRYLLPSTFSFPLALTPRRLVEWGVYEEDAGERALNHFFDPQHDGRALTIDILGYEKLLGKPSPLWALEDRADVEGQAYSYKDAKASLKNSLTAPTRPQRDRALGYVFESLGHVVHHLQDMAQPQHVRNDAHCKELFSPRFYPFPVPQCVLGFYRPSAYEAYMLSRGTQLPLGGYPVADAGSFSEPRYFWEYIGSGIAEFTSANFVSVGTNLRIVDGYIVPGGDYLSPGFTSFVSKRQITDPDLLGPMGPKQPLSGEIWFVGTPVKDYYRLEETLNARTSTFSLFANELAGTGSYRAFSLNRFNYAAAADFLLPRAAAYSTGMLNYFFRGRIEIAPPQAGVYGVVDHAETNVVTNTFRDGFSAFRVKLRNITPPGVSPDGADVVQQEMPNGTLKAIAKYLVNPCYQPDLLGEYDGSPVAWTGVITRNGCTLMEYFGGVEEISISKELVGQSLDRGTAQEFTFDFSDKPIPINAHDLSIQIVYEGVLGAEQDAIVVSGRNISEPTYISVINGSDYFLIDGKLYTPEEIRGNDELRSRVGGHNIDPEPIEDVVYSIGGVPVTGVGSIPPKGYHRLAVLADAEFEPPMTGPAPIPLKIQVRFAHDLWPSVYQFQPPPIRNQLARSPSTISMIRTRRGITAWFNFYYSKGLAGSTLTSAEIESKPPMDPSCFDGTTWSCVPDPTPISVVYP